MCWNFELFLERRGPLPIQQIKEAEIFFVSPGGGVGPRYKWQVLAVLWFLYVVYHSFSIVIELLPKHMMCTGTLPQLSSNTSSPTMLKRAPKLKCCLSNWSFFKVQKITEAWFKQMLRILKIPLLDSMQLNVTFKFKVMPSKLMHTSYVHCVCTPVIHNNPSWHAAVVPLGASTWFHSLINVVSSYKEPCIGSFTSSLS